MKNNWTKSPWTVGLVCSAFGFGLTVFYDLVKEEPILSTLSNLIIYFLDVVLLLLTFNIKVWWIITFVAVTILVLFLIAKYKSSFTIRPEYLDYTTDRFRRWRWSWTWYLNSKKRVWMVNNLTAHCPQCDTPLIDNTGIMGVRFGCPRCNYDAFNDECDIPSYVEQVILDNIKRKTNIDKR